MLQLFTNHYLPTGNVTMPGLFPWIQRNMAMQLLQAKHYYATRILTVPNQHLLNRILTTGMPPIDYPLERFLEVANARSPYVAKHFQLTSSIEVGKAHKDVFYGQGCTEFILSVEGYINPFGDMSAVYGTPCLKVLTQPTSELSYAVPNGQRYSDATGLSVVSIDIPKMLVQYRRFVLQKRHLASQGVETNSSTLRFIETQLLPQLLDSHLDSAWFNRVMNAYYGGDGDDGARKLPMVLTDYTKHLDATAQDIVNRLKKSRSMYGHALQNIPALFSKNMMEFLQLPDTAYTRQVWWLLVLSRFKAMKFLTDIGGAAGVRVNRTYVNQLQIDISRLLRNGIPQGVLPADVEMDFKIDAGIFTRL